MIVLGIDPGYDRMGAAIVEKQGAKETVLFSACLSSPKKADFGSRLLSLGEQLEPIIKKWKPAVLATEKLFLSNNKKTASGVSEVRGMVAYLAAKNGLAIAEFTPMQIKINITGHGGADKKQMTGMIDKLVSLKKRKRLDDEYDAIGAALTYLACYRLSPK